MSERNHICGDPNSACDAECMQRAIMTEEQRSNYYQQQYRTWRTEALTCSAERDQLRAELEKLRGELDDAEERASEAEERCAAEWEKDCGQALRILAQVTKFEWDQDGSPADEVREHIQMTLESLEKQVVSLRAELAAAKALAEANWTEGERLRDSMWEYRSDNARLRAAMNRAYEGAARQLAEPRNHDNDQYALTDIATTCELALAATPAQSLEAVTAPLEAHINRLRDLLDSFAYWGARFGVFAGTKWADEQRLSQEAHWINVYAKEAKELLAATPAQSLAAHDAAVKVAVLREVADREFNPEQSAEQRWAHGVLHGNADRIATEAANGQA